MALSGKYYYMILPSTRNLPGLTIIRNNQNKIPRFPFKMIKSLLQK